MKRAWALPLLYLSFFCNAQQKRQFDVRLFVTADAAHQAEVTSYASRELRSLGDVVLVDDNPNFKIRVIVMSVTNQMETPLGFSVCYIFSKILRPDPETYQAMTSALRGKDLPMQLAILDLSMKLTLSEQILTAGVMSCASQDLRKCMSDIITNFDSEELNAERAALPQK